MLDQSNDTPTGTVCLPSPLAKGDEWEEVLARLPEGWQEQAQAWKAMQAIKEVSGPADLLRGLLEYQLADCSFCQLGAWSMLSGLADISEAAWRKHFRLAGPWLSWMLSQVLAIQTTQLPWLSEEAKGLRRIVLVDGTHLRCQGPKGDTWRIHTAFDLLAGRISEVQVTAHHVGEDWRRFEIHANDLFVSDAINGYVEHLADLRKQQAHGLVRFSPKTLPLYDEQGERIDVLQWLKQRHAPAARVCRQKVWIQAADGSKHELRLIALRLTPEQTLASQRRKIKKAGQDHRKIQADTLYFAGWLLLVTSLPEETWSDAEVLALYRARWHIEMLFKRIKQLLDTHRLRCSNRESVKTSIVLCLLTWVLQEETAAQLRGELEAMQDELQDPKRTYAQPLPQQGQDHALSEWMLSSVCLGVLRDQVHIPITQARLCDCLPRLRRFLRSSPRKRTHWYSQVCRWLGEPTA